ncbi:MAG: hypothetical protein VKN33_02610 [Candidatus Sericytochromatia bacterium]|nr:hypothetical protein [Candidatus Sericytochromatia bacterium]
MLKPQIWSGLASSCLIAALAVVSLTACQGPTTVIGRATPTVGSAGTGSSNTTATVNARPQIIIKFRNELRISEIAAFRSTYGLTNVGAIPELGVYIEEFLGDRPVQDLLRELQSSPMVIYAELNQQVTLPLQ